MAQLCAWKEVMTPEWPVTKSFTKLKASEPCNSASRARSGRMHMLAAIRSAGVTFATPARPEIEHVLAVLVTRQEQRASILNGYASFSCPTMLAQALHQGGLARTGIVDNGDIAPGAHDLLGVKRQNLT
jgi:hypothetical protein